MAGASDKARFYLEQSIPELKDLEKKKLFNKNEIISIAKRRSEFEHKLNARGSRPVDYARYVEYEMNLESLRHRRANRQGVKTGGHAGQRRILFILDRATRKFHGDIGLWVQYLQYATKQKASKKVSEILAAVLRLHPTKPELWVAAAKHATEEQGDMTEARSYMQRGLRFCKQSTYLWLEYTKLELIFISKLSSRRKILGLDQSHQVSDMDNTIDDPDADLIKLPVITVENIEGKPNLDNVIEESTIAAMENTLNVLEAIPIAIFDAAMQQFKDPQLGELFFNMVADFKNIPCLGNIIQHITNHLMKIDPNSPSTQNCYIRQPWIGVHIETPQFPRAIGTSLSRLKIATGTEPSFEIVSKTIDWIAQFLQREELDPDLHKALSATLRKTVKQLKAAWERKGSIPADGMSAILEKLQACKLAQNKSSTL